MSITDSSKAPLRTRILMTAALTVGCWVAAIISARLLVTGVVWLADMFGVNLVLATLSVLAAGVWWMARGRA